MTDQCSNKDVLHQCYSGPWIERTPEYNKPSRWAPLWRIQVKLRPLQRIPGYIEPFSRVKMVSLYPGFTVQAKEEQQNEEWWCPDVNKSNVLVILPYDQASDTVAFLNIQHNRIMCLTCSLWQTGRKIDHREKTIRSNIRNKREHFTVPASVRKWVKVVETRTEFEYRRISNYWIALDQKTSVYRGTQGHRGSACVPNENLKERLSSCSQYLSSLVIFVMMSSTNCEIWIQSVVFQY